MLMVVEQLLERMSGRRNWSTRRKSAPVPVCPLQISHDLTQARNRAAAVVRQQLTARATARPYSYLSIRLLVNLPRNESSLFRELFPRFSYCISNWRRCDCLISSRQVRVACPAWVFNEHNTGRCLRVLQCYSVPQHYNGDVVLRCRYVSNT
jgi:hypothetical protein